MLIPHEQTKEMRTLKKKFQIAKFFIPQFPLAPKEKDKKKNGAFFTALETHNEHLVFGA